MNTALIEEIEAIQERAIKSLGRSPNEIRKFIDASKNSSKIGGAHFNLEYGALRLPEKYYRNRDELEEYYNALPRTKYDLKPFLDRFINTADLCHEYFVEDCGYEKQEISIFSLPYAHVNGVTFRSNTNDWVVLLNEGLIYLAPPTIDLAMHMAESSHMLPTTVYEQLSQENLEHLEQVFENCFVPFFTSTVDILTGDLTPYSKLKTNPELDVHAYENWDLRRQIGLQSASFLSEDEQQYIADRANYERGRFHACRGYYTFLLGHEFSHVYNNHHAFRSQNVLLRDKRECQEMFKILKKQIGSQSPSFDDLFTNNHFYMTSQPTETEADAHGLMCAAKYCVENELELEQRQLVIKGALTAFLHMECIDRICMLSQLSEFECDETLKTKNWIRNVLYPSEHPCPFSRVEGLLNHEVWVDVGEIRKFVAEVWDSMSFIFDWFWFHLKSRLTTHLNSIQFAPNTLHNSSHLFEHYSAVGCYAKTNWSGSE